MGRRVQARGPDAWIIDARRVGWIGEAASQDRRHGPEWREAVELLTGVLQGLLVAEPELDAESLRIARRRLAEALGAEAAR